MIVLPLGADPNVAEYVGSITVDPCGTTPLYMVSTSWVTNRYGKNVSQKGTTYFRNGQQTQLYTLETGEFDSLGNPRVLYRVLNSPKVAESAQRRMPADRAVSEPRASAFQRSKRVRAAG